MTPTNFRITTCINYSWSCCQSRWTVVLYMQHKFIISAWPPLISLHKFWGTQKSRVIQQFNLVLNTNRKQLTLRKKEYAFSFKYRQQVRPNILIFVKRSESNKLVNRSLWKQNLSVQQQGIIALNLSLKPLLALHECSLNTSAGVFLKYQNPHLTQELYNTYQGQPGIKKITNHKFKILTEMLPNLSNTKWTIFQPKNKKSCCFYLQCKI